MTNLETKYAHLCLIHNDFPSTLRHALEYYDTVYKVHLVQLDVKTIDEVLSAAVGFINDYIIDNPRPPNDRFRQNNMTEIKDLIRHLKGQYIVKPNSRYVQWH